MNDIFVPLGRVDIPCGDALKETIEPLIDGKKLVAVKVYYVYERDFGVRDVGTFFRSKDKDAQAERLLNLGAFCEAAMFYPELAGPVGFLYVGRLLQRWHKMRRSLGEKLARLKTYLG